MRSPESVPDAEAPAQEWLILTGPRAAALEPSTLRHLSRRAVLTKAALSCLAGAVAVDLGRKARRRAHPSH